MYLRFPLSLKNAEDLLVEGGIDVCQETIRFWWNRFGPIFAADICRQRVSTMRGFRHWRWHLDDVFVRVKGGTHYLWRGHCQTNGAGYGDWAVSTAISSGLLLGHSRA